MATCACCKIKTWLVENNLHTSVKLTTSGPQVVITVSHVDGCDAVKASSPRADGKAKGAKEEALKAPVSPATNPVDAKPKETKSKTKAAKKEIKDAGLAKEDNLIQKNVVVAPVEKKRNAYKLSIVFPKLRRNQDFLIKTKPAIFFAVSKNVQVEMVDAEGLEVDLWTQAFPQITSPQQLIAVRIQPFPWETPEEGAKRYEKLMEVFKECNRKVIIDVEQKQVFYPPYTLPKKVDAPAPADAAGGGADGGRANSGGTRRQRPRGGGAEGATNSVANKTCDYCQELGHIARTCPKKQADNAGSKPERQSNRAPREDNREYSCYNCGQVGHMSRNCPSEKKGDEDAKADTPKDVAERLAATRCRRCGELGHIARNCPSKPAPKPAAEGDASGAAAAAATEGQRKPSGVCHYCKKEGHFVRDCPEKVRDISEGTVKPRTYVRRDAPRKEDGANSTGYRGGGGRGNRTQGCYNCGDPDHYARDCPQPRKESSS